MSATIRRAKVIRADLALWDGRTTSYTRQDASGGTVTGLPVGTEVDVLQVYGSGTSRTRASIVAATNNVGTSAATLVFSPGTWTIDASLTIPSNFTCHISSGCVFSVDSGQTLTFSGPVIADSSTFYTGSGTTTLSVDSLVGGKRWLVRTAAEVAAGVTPTDHSREPYDVRRYGATGDGSTDDATALQNWLNAVPTDGEGYLPAASVYYKTTAALTRTNRLSVRGEGLVSRIHYTGTGVGLTVNDGRFSQFLNWYLSGTSSAAGGLYIKAAQEGFHTEGFVCDGFSGASAYAGRFSDCWDITLKAGAFRQSTTGLLFDTTVVSSSGINNVVNILGVDCSATGIGVDFQAGDLCNIIGVDFTNGGGITPVAAIEIGRGLTGSKFVRSVNIMGNWFEGTGAAVRVGRSNTSSATPDQINIDGNFFGNTGDQVYLYKAQSVAIGKNLWGSGAIIIDSGVTGTRIEKRGVTITDNSTAGETRYFANDTVQADEIVPLDLLRVPALVRFTGALSPAQITGDQNNYNPTGLSTANVLRLTSDTTRTITGMVPPAQNAVLMVFNFGSSTITLSHENASSTAANRFTFAGGSDVALTRTGGIMLYYDQGSSRWMGLQP